MFKYRLNEPICGEPELKFLENVIKSNYLGINGEYTKKFENAFAKLHNNKYGLAVQSGTAAVHTALTAIHATTKLDVNGWSRAGIKYLAVPEFTCAGSVHPYFQLQQDKLPVYLDVDPETFGIDFKSFKEAYNQIKFDAIILVHVYGTPARDYEQIAEFCKKNNIWLIEDCAESHGAKTKNGIIVGSLGDIATFSVRSEKLIGVGEGGIVLTNNEMLYHEASWFANRCKEKDDLGWQWKYKTSGVGVNYLMPHLLGAFAYGQLHRLQPQIMRRREIGRLYRILLPWMKWQEQDYDNSSFWLNFGQFPIDMSDNNKIGKALYDNATSDVVLNIGNYLMKHGVEIRPGFFPMSLHSDVTEKRLSDYMFRNSVADKLVYSGLCFPSHPNLLDSDIGEICNLVTNAWDIYGE